MAEFGILNVYKPPGMTSRRVVDHVESLAPNEKVGHAGTLDPLAEGVLVLCLGKATRLVPYVQKQPKTYLAEFLLDHSSETDDTEGDVSVVANEIRPSLESIEAVLPCFLGQIFQVPPKFSAAKIGGKRAYKLARKGKEFEIRERQVRIDSLKLLHYDYPKLNLQITCGGGTYIRSLGRDIAASLGTSAVMSGLVRESIGPFDTQSAARWDDLTVDSWRRFLVGAARAVYHLPSIQISAAEEQLLCQGRALEARPVESDSTEVAAFDVQGELVALLKAPDPGDKSLRPYRVFR